MNMHLDPTKAKLAAKIMRKQQAELSSATEKIAELSKDLDLMKRHQDCVKIAHQMSEKGIIPRDFGSILEKAESLSASDTKLEVIKEAMEMAQSNFELGSPDKNKSVGGRADAITEVLMSLGS